MQDKEKLGEVFFRIRFSETIAEAAFGSLNNQTSLNFRV